tara:strand:+ start:477 stop:692 length:216 start_codon:yes stop_codon:yes gene_type:complete
LCCGGAVIVSIIGILSISKDSLNLGGGIGDISNIRLREEVVYEVEQLPPLGERSTLPFPVYTRYRSNPGGR